MIHDLTILLIYLYKYITSYFIEISFFSFLHKNIISVSIHKGLNKFEHKITLTACALNKFHVIITKDIIL